MKFWKLLTFSSMKFFQNSKFKAFKIVKTAVFHTFWNWQKLISRRIYKYVNENLVAFFPGQMDEGRDKEPPASGPPQNSKFEWPLLFERASKNWWHPQFDSHILEQQYWKSLLPRTTKRFRFGLFYLAFMSGICCMYYGLMAVDEWLTFFLIFLLVFIAVITILILTFVKEYFYRNHCFKISLSKYCKLDY